MLLACGRSGWLVCALVFGWCGTSHAQMGPAQPTLPGSTATPGAPSAPVVAAKPDGQSTSQPASAAEPDTNKAAAEPSEALRASYDAAFQESLENPADPAVLAKFAEVAVQFGDIEGAISALERLLLIDGAQAEVKLELGVLYFRLGSNEAARSYLEAASASPEASSDIKERAQTFLKTLGDK